MTTFADKVRQENPLEYEKARLIVDATQEIKVALEDAGLTMAELSRRCGKSRAIVSRQLQGSQNLSLAKIAELAFVLGKRFSFELKDIDEKPELQVDKSVCTLRFGFTKKVPPFHVNPPAGFGDRSTKHIACA